MNRKQRRQELKEEIPDEVMWVFLLCALQNPMGIESYNKAADIMKRHPKYFQ